MNRLRKRRYAVEHDDIHRWLVSYADYMTLMFALFVVLYAMAMVNEKPFETITESLGRVFHVYEDETQNSVHGDNVLMVNTDKKSKKTLGSSVLNITDSGIVDSEKSLSNISGSQVGTNLSSLKDALHTTLDELIESGFAQLQINGDWLEIELSSGLLFPSGSSSATNSAETILSVIYDVIGQASNFIRVRGYTDNQIINNEIYSSNWELSVFRATAILRVLEGQGLNPARMAIEGYGEYYPSADNLTAQGRARNRKVVLAISKYGLEDINLLKAPMIELINIEAVSSPSMSNEQSLETSQEIKVIRLDSGGIRITTRDEKEKVETKNSATTNKKINDDIE